MDNNHPTDTQDPKPDTPDPSTDDLIRACAQAQAEAAAELTPRYSDLGTLCSRAWDDEWIAAVNAAESRLARRICGARTLAGIPCTLESNHPNGRCRFHGGFDLTGAPKGNRNAVIHGLYSRQLQLCGPHCLRWETCPCAGQDLLELPAAQRPICPYEQTQYNTVLSDALAKIEHQPDPDPLDKHLAHDLALLQVMMTRAAAALAVDRLTETVSATGDHYQLQSSKLNATFQAFLRVTQEYRAFRRLLDQNAVARVTHEPVSQPTLKSVIRQDTRSACDTDLEPAAQQELHPEQWPLLEHADCLVRKAARHAARGDQAAVLDTMHLAEMLNPLAAHTHVERVIAAYRPKGQVLPDNVLRVLLRQLKIDPDTVLPPAKGIFARYARSSWDPLPVNELNDTS